MMQIILQIFILLISLNGVLSQVTPTWITSNYLQAASKKVIDGDACNCKTSNLSTPSATVPFPTSFPSLPNLGYGISSYQGDDYLSPQQFQVNRTQLTTSSFSVLIQIVGYTHIWVIEVRFIAISKSFPHHVNSFDNVPINYMSTLVNITTMNSKSLRQYQNIINYTLQANSIGSNYRYFSLPLTNNKVLIFLTTLYIKCSSTYSGARVNMRVTVQPLSIDTYRLLVSLDYYQEVYKLHFSIVTFDQIQVQASGKYLLVYKRIQFTDAGGYYNFPIEFINNFMVGFVEFGSTKWNQAIHFIINYVVVGGVHRLQMPKAIPRPPKASPVVRFNFNLFYLKTWICPNNTIFDPALDLCVGCPVINCVNCFNLTTCTLCKQSNGYFINQTTRLCEICSIEGCITCTNLTICADCNQTLGYVLTGSICQLCQSNLNYFADQTSQSCILCSLSHCINCSSLIQCRQCDSMASYFLGTGGVCLYCDPALNNFIYPTTKDCVPCPVAFCTICSSYSTCQTCSIGYLINSTNNLCFPCNQVGCDNCLTLTICTRCSLGYYLDGNNQCQPCGILGCLNCTSPSICVECDEMNRYYLSLSSCIQCSVNQFPNLATSSCQSCTLLQCLACLTLTTCSNCNSNNFYYLLPSGTCGYCDPAIDKFISSNFSCQTCSLSYCTDCTSLTSCAQCNNSQNYFMNLTDNLCYYCSALNCKECLDLNVCSICNVGFFFNPITNNCQACTILGCLNCSNLLTCIECDYHNNYIPNGYNSTCQICPVGTFANSISQNCQNCTIIGCTVCGSLSTCLSCQLSSFYYLLPSGICGYCNASENAFINITTLDCNLCLISYCTQCSSLSTCLACNVTAMHLLNSTDNLCYPCTISNCIFCSTFTICSICNYTIQYFPNNTNGQCQLCTLANCLKCSSLTSCFLCDLANNYGLDFMSLNMSLCGPCNVSCVCDGYGLPWDPVNLLCTPICGDGLLRGDEECDDSNTQSLDGCSSICKIQRLYTCINEPSFCYSYFYILGELIEYERTGCNMFKATLYTPGLTFNEVGKNIFIYQPGGLNILQKKENNKYIDIYVEYSKDLINQTIYIDFVPGETITFVYNSTIPPMYYSENQCQNSQRIKQLLMAIQIISYIVLLFSILSCKIIGLQLFGVLQLCFFTLSSQDFLNIYLAPFIQFKTFNGLNIDLFKETSPLPAGIKTIKMNGVFLNNLNIMLGLFFAEFIIGLLIYLIGRLTVGRKAKKIGIKLLKEGFITLILFNIFNIAFSAGIHLRFASSNDSGYVPSTIALFFTLFLIILALFGMLMTRKQGYGQFKKKFKNNCVCELYIPFTVCYRISLGFYAAYQNTYEFNSLIILAFSFVFIMFFAVNLPFIDFYQNYRAGLVHLTMLCTLLTSNYYRNMKSTTPIQIKSKLFIPAVIQLVLIVLTLVVSVLVLGYEIYPLLKGWMNRKVAPTHEKNSINPVNESNVEATLQNIPVQLQN